MNLYGPINSGIGAGGAGVATNNATTSTPVIGAIVAVCVRYNDTPPATTDVTIATAGTDAPANTIITLTDVTADGWFYPQHQIDSAAGAAIADLYMSPPVHDFIKVTIAQANNGDSVDVWLLVAE